MSGPRATSPGPAGFVPLLAALCLALAAVAALVVWPRFDGLYGQDAFAYWDYARGALDRALRRGELPPPFFWPPGFPLAVWLATTVAGASPRAAQGVALLAGAAVPIVTGMLAWELFVAPRGRGRDGGERRGPAEAADPPANRLGGERAAGFLPLLAGALVAFHGQLWQSSVVVMADTTALAAGTTGVWLTARWGRTNRTGTLLAAAASMAFAVLARWAYALVAVPVTVFALHRLAATAGGEKPAGRSPARAALQALGAAAVVAAVLSPVWIGAALGPVAEGSVGRAFAGNFEVYSWSPLNAARRAFVTADGLLRYRWPNGLYYALAPAHRYFFTPLLAAFLLPGAWWLWRSRNASRGWLLAGWVGVVLAFHAGAPYQNFRFTLAYLPPLAIVAGLGITGLWSRIGERVPGTARRWVARAALVGTVVLGLGAMAWGGVDLTRSFIERKRAHLRTVRWVEERTPPGSRVLAFNLFFTLRHYGARETRHLFFETPGSVAGLADSDRPTFLLLETASFTTQWEGHPSWEAVRRLRERDLLTERGSHREYDLYRVEPPREGEEAPADQPPESEREPAGTKASSRAR